MLIFQQRKQDDRGNCRWVNLTLDPCERMEQLMWDPVHKEIKNGNVITASQHDFMQNRLS